MDKTLNEVNSSVGKVFSVLFVLLMISGMGITNEPAYAGSKGFAEPVTRPMPVGAATAHVKKGKAGAASISGRPVFTGIHRTSSKPELSLSYQSASPREPYQPESFVTVQTSVRNSGRTTASIKVVQLGARRSGGIQAQSPVVLVRSGATARTQIRIKIDTRHINNDTYKTRLFLFDASVPDSRGPLAQTWLDRNSSNNNITLTFRTQGSVYNVRAQLLSIRLNHNCDHNPRKRINWEIHSTGWAGVSSGGSYGEARAMHDRTRTIYRYPRNNGIGMASGGMARLHQDFRFTNMVKDASILLSVTAAENKAVSFQWEPVRYAGEVTLILNSGQWLHGGRFTADSVRGRGDCPANGTFTAVWQVWARPVTLR